jgi:hypothetical protein
MLVETVSVRRTASARWASRGKMRRRPVRSKAMRADHGHAMAGLASLSGVRRSATDTPLWHSSWPVLALTLAVALTLVRADVPDA